MSEHGWPDFHDDGLHHDDGHHEEPLPADDPLPELHHDDDPGFYDTHDAEGFEHHDGGAEPAAHDDGHENAAWEQPDDTAGHEQGEPHEVETVGADPDALAEPDAEAVSLFPPVLDVGELPEPVDGFPWIDTGSLGLVDPATVHDAAAASVSPQELAEYAGTELAPGVDPWAALADSDDPATSALAKWWSENT